MNPFLAALDFSTSGLVSQLAYIAILALVIWGIFAILQHFGVGIHPIVRIVLSVVVGIVLIVLLVRALGTVL